MTCSYPRHEEIKRVHSFYTREAIPGTCIYLKAFCSVVICILSNPSKSRSYCCFLSLSFLNKYKSVRLYYFSSVINVDIVASFHYPFQVCSNPNTELIQLGFRQDLRLVCASKLYFHWDFCR